MLNEDIAQIVEDALNAPSILDENTLKPMPSLKDDWSTWLAWFNTRYAHVYQGNKVQIMRENRGADPERRLRFQDQKDFLSWYADKRLPIPHTNKTETVGKLWLNDPRRRKYDGTIFVPGGPPEILKANEKLYNFWRGFEVVPIEGDCSLLIQHLFDVICSEDADHYAWLLQWFAHLIQKPSEQIGTAVVLRGGQGAGKTWVGRAIGELISMHYLLVSNPAHLVGQFNAHMQRLLLIQADEGFWAGDKVAEGTLKSLITGHNLAIEPKNVDLFATKNYVRLLVTSNEHWVVPAGFDERRFAVFDVASTHLQDHAYFERLDKEWKNGGREAFLDLLMKEPITLNLRKIPKTEALLEQKIATLHPIHSWWVTILQQGFQLKELEGWQAWMSSEELYTKWIEDARMSGVRRPGDREEFFKRLKQVVPIERKRLSQNGTRPWGYAFPSLKDARATFEGRIHQIVDWGEMQ